LIDAGTLANSQGGFLSDSLRFSREDGGKVEFQRGEWKKLKSFSGRISDSVFPLPAGQPSPVLFQLLGLLMQVTKESGHQTDLLQGVQPNANAPASSTLALLQQGKQSFGPVYKRHLRSLKAEADAIFDLTFMYEDQETYQIFTDDPAADVKKDFARAGIDVIPVAEPEFSTRTTRMQQGEALKGLIGDPRVNGAAILKHIVYSITNDKAQTALFVPDEPNMSPEQVLQKLETQKAELLTHIEVQQKELGLQTAAQAYNTQMLLLQTAMFNAQIAAKEAGGSVDLSVLMPPPIDVTQPPIPSQPAPPGAPTQ
jgi:chaperonin GroES